MKQIPNVSVAVTAGHFQKAADLIENEAVQNANGDMSWVACINAAFAVEIYLKSFLTEKVLTATGTGMNLVTQKAQRGHDLLELYQKISADMQTLMLDASQEIDLNLDLVKLISRCKDYFFHARYSYEKESLQCLSSDVLILARHMKQLVRKVSVATPSS